MKKTLIFLLVLISILTFAFSSFNVNEVTAAIPSGYYSTTEGLNGDALLEELAEITQSNHKYYTSYDDIKYSSKGNPSSDRDPNNSSNLLDFYSGISLSSAWDGGNTWNREHVWPQSLSGGLYGTSGAGSDIHHIRPTINSINSSRGNQKFGDVNKQGEKKYNGTPYGYSSGGVFEPLDNVKGDVARIVMYMYMHYSKEVDANSSHSKAGNLSITNIMQASSKDSAFDLLCAWNKLDPVDKFESDRNEFCAKTTGTRNPFIDNPEFADRIWQGGSSAGQTYKVSYSVGDATFSYTDLTAYEYNTTIKEPNVEPTLSGYDFEGWYKDNDYANKWNFSTDKITSNLTLYAKFVKEETPITSFTQVFENLKIKSQLTFDVVEEMVEDGVVPQSKEVIINKYTSGDGSLTKGNYDLANYLEFDTNLFDIQYNSNSASNAYVSASKGEVRLYPGSGNGSSIVITAKTGVKITDIKYTVSSETTLTPSLKIETDGSKATIQNVENATSKNRIDIKTITISYEVGSVGPKLAYKLVPNSLFLNYVVELTEAQYLLYEPVKDDVKLFVNNQEVSYKLYKVGDNYQLKYRIKVQDVNTTYVPVLKYNGEEVQIAGYSAKTLASFYLQNVSTDELVKKYKDCLSQIIG